jgi:hypothetical protein
LTKWTNPRYFRAIGTRDTGAAVGARTIGAVADGTEDARAVRAVGAGVTGSTEAVGIGAVGALGARASPAGAVIGGTEAVGAGAVRAIGAGVTGSTGAIGIEAAGAGPGGSNSDG